MRPNRARAWDRALVAASVGALLAAGTLATARADTVVTGEGIFMPRGSTAKQFGGAFCEHNTCLTVSSMPTSVRLQAAKLDAAVMQSTGQVTMLIYSLSAAAGHRVLTDWAADPSTAPDPDRVRVVTTGNPYNRYGGTDRNRSSAVPVPDGSQYDRLDVVMAYDSVADKPARWGWYSAIEVSLSRHMAYDEADINDPTNLITADGSYMLIPAKELRQLRWLKPWVSEERFAEIEADRRAKIEKDFDRPELTPQGPGADWANGVEPESLREESDEAGRHESDVRVDEAEDTEARRGLDDDVESRDGDSVADSDRRESRVASERDVEDDTGTSAGAESVGSESDTEDSE